MAHRPELPSVSERRLRQQHRPPPGRSHMLTSLEALLFATRYLPPIAVEKFLDPTTQRNFVLKLHNRFALLSESDEYASSIENLWKEGRNYLKETSHAVLGPRRRKKHQWISDETLGTIYEHRTARPRGWQQGPGTTSCYQTQTTTTTR